MEDLESLLTSSEEMETVPVSLEDMLSASENTEQIPREIEQMPDISEVSVDAFSRLPEVSTMQVDTSPEMSLEESLTLSENPPQIGEIPTDTFSDHRAEDGTEILPTPSLGIETTLRGVFPTPATIISDVVAFTEADGFAESLKAARDNHLDYVFSGEDKAAELLEPTSNESPLMTAGRATLYALDAIISPTAILAAPVKAITKSVGRESTVSSIWTRVGVLNKNKHIPLEIRDDVNTPLTEVDDILIDIKSGKITAAQQAILNEQALATDLHKTTDSLKDTDVVKGVKDFIRDPAMFTRFKLAGKLSEEERNVYQSLHDAQSQRAIDAHHVDNMNIALMKDTGLHSISIGDQKTFMRIIREADRVNLESPRRLTEDELLNMFGGSPSVSESRAISHYNQYVEGMNTQGNIINDIRKRSGREKITTNEGYIPHTWSGNYVVKIENSEMETVRVVTFNTERAARKEAKRVKGARYLGDSSRDSSVEAVIAELEKVNKEIKETTKLLDKADKGLSLRQSAPLKKNQKRHKRIIRLAERGAKVAKIRASRASGKSQRLSTARLDDGKNISTVNASQEKRKGVAGYTNLDNFSDFVGSVQRIRSSHVENAIGADNVSRIEKVMKDAVRLGADSSDMISVAKHLAETYKRSPHTWDKATGQFLRSATFHMNLGIAEMNTTVPAMNIVSALLLKGVAQGTAMTIAGVSKRDISNPQGSVIGRAAESVQAAFLPKALWTSKTLAAKIAELEKAGVIPKHATQSSLGNISEEVGAGVYGTVSGTLRKVKEIGLKVNSSLMTGTELSSKRAIAVSGLDLGKSLGFDGDKLYRFVSNMTQQTSGDFTKGLRSRAFEGGDGVVSETVATTLTMQSYVYKRILEIGLVAKTTANSKRLTGQRDIRTALLTLASTYMLMGAKDIPIINTLLDNIAQGMDDGDGETIKKYQELRNDLDGSWGYSSGFDVISEKLGIGMDISKNTAYGLPMGIGSEYGLSAGAFVGTVRRVEGFLAGGNERRKSLPNGWRTRIDAKNALERGHWTGYADSVRNKTMTDDVTNYVALFSAMTPTKVARHRTKYFQQRGRDKYTSDRLREFIRINMPSWTDKAQDGVLGLSQRETKEVLDLWMKAHPQSNNTFYLQELLGRIYVSGNPIVDSYDLRKQPRIF